MVRSQWRESGLSRHLAWRDVIQPPNIRLGRARLVGRVCRLEFRKPARVVGEPAVRFWSIRTEFLAGHNWTPCDFPVHGLHIWFRSSWKGQAEQLPTRDSREQQSAPCRFCVPLLRERTHRVWPLLYLTAVQRACTRSCELTLLLTSVVRSLLVAECLANLYETSVLRGFALVEYPLNRQHVASCLIHRDGRAITRL